MKNGILAFVLGGMWMAATAAAQSSPLMLPPQVEKVLESRAANVSEVTLGKNMLQFAAKVMNGKKGDDAAIRQLILGLDGIYVRDYEFDKPGEYSLDDVAKVRQAFETPEWSPMVRERERKSGESTDVMVKMVNGESHGIFILSAEPKELAIVLILGPIRMEDLGKLKGLAGLGGALNGVSQGGKTKKGGAQ
jgi:hypothetical protein